MDRIQSYKLRVNIWAIDILLIGLMLTLVGCRSKTPEINRIRLNSTPVPTNGISVPAGSQNDLLVEFAPNGYRIDKCVWKIDGKEMPGSGKHLIPYQASDIPGEYTISVQLQSSGKTVAEESIVVTVLPSPGTPEPQLLAGITATETAVVAETATAMTKATATTKAARTATAVIEATETAVAALTATAEAVPTVREIDIFLKGNLIEPNRLPSLTKGEVVELKVVVVDTNETKYASDDLVCVWSVEPLGEADIGIDTDNCETLFMPSQVYPSQTVTVTVKGLFDQFEPGPPVTLEFVLTD